MKDYAKKGDLNNKEALKEARKEKNIEDAIEKLVKTGKKTKNFLKEHSGKAVSILTVYAMLHTGIQLSSKKENTELTETEEDKEEMKNINKEYKKNTDISQKLIETERARIEQEENRLEKLRKNTGQTHAELLEEYIQEEYHEFQKNRGLDKHLSDRRAGIYSHAIIKASEKYHVPKTVLTAVLNHETGFTNTTGDQNNYFKGRHNPSDGLGQISRVVQKETLKRMKEEGIDIEDYNVEDGGLIYHPELGIEMTAYHLNYLKEQIKDEQREEKLTSEEELWRTVVGCYNGGLKGGRKKYVEGYKEGVEEKKKKLNQYLKNSEVYREEDSWERQKAIDEYNEPSKEKREFKVTQKALRKNM